MPVYASICQHIEQLRDFADEAVAFLLAKDPNFKPSDATMWQDHAPVPETTDDPTANLHLGTADDKLQNLSKDARQKAWEHDSLSLARDVAAIAKMHQQVLKNDKADRLRRIAHVRSENMIGGSVVSNYMEQHAKHIAGAESDLITCVEQALETWCCLSARWNLLKILKQSWLTLKIIGFAVRSLFFVFLLSCLSHKKNPFL